MMLVSLGLYVKKTKEGGREKVREKEEGRVGEEAGFQTLGQKYQGKAEPRKIFFPVNLIT